MSQQHTTPLDPSLNPAPPPKALTTYLNQSSPYLMPAALCAFLFLTFLTTVPLEANAQTWLAYLLLALLLGLRLFRKSEVLRIALYALAAFVTVRYLWWRTFHTLGWHDLQSWVCALTLYFAEMYGMCIFLLGMFTNVHPIRREPHGPSGHPATWPTIDVFVPTYNEEPGLVEITVAAATLMNYPPDRFKVWICDDGGTVQRMNHANPAVAAEAARRAAELKAIAAKHGAHYTTREKNVHAKAGNLNSALEVTEGEIILILDADHIPTHDFLQKTVGFMQRDKDVFLVQTPHFFVNPDPFEKNHAVFGRIPGENEMFYQVIQPGLDFWNSAFFCGSAALMRRKHLLEVGGISGISITEDAETALDLHAKGYKSIFYDRPLISGLQPETYSSFIVQRVRWAQGMIQIFLLKNPALQPGLKWYQRLNYTSNSFFWFFGFARMVFLFAPLAYLVFGLKIYDANMSGFIAYALPYVVASIVIADYLYGHVRWTFVSEVYELLQSIFTAPALIRVFLNPRAPSFMVTPKGELNDREFISSLSGPFYVVWFVTVFGMICGVLRWIYVPEDRQITSITMVWETLNFLIVNAAAGVLFERRQRRASPRMPANIPAFVALEDGDTAEAVIADLSVGGASILVSEEGGARFRQGQVATVRCIDPATNRPAEIQVTLASIRKTGDGQLNLGTAFIIEDVDAQRTAISLAHGDSQRWTDFQQNRFRHPGIVMSFLFLITLAFSWDKHRLRAFGTDLQERWRVLFEVVSGPFRRGRAASDPT